MHGGWQVFDLFMHALLIMHALLRRFDRASFVLSVPHPCWGFGDWKFHAVLVW
jgi:hypothetical protein